MLDVHNIGYDADYERETAHHEHSAVRSMKRTMIERKKSSAVLSASRSSVNLSGGEVDKEKADENTAKPRKSMGLVSRLLRRRSRSSAALDPSVAKANAENKDEDIDARVTISMEGEEEMEEENVDADDEVKVVETQNSVVLPPRRRNSGLVCAAPTRRNSTRAIRATH